MPTSKEQSGGFIMLPTNDFSFKKLFGDERHPEYLTWLLEAIFKANVTCIEIKNVEITGDFHDEKRSLLDIKATLNRSECVNIEMQVSAAGEMANRSLFYWSRIYSQQLKRGDLYEDLQRVVCINILNYSISLNDKIHNVARLRLDDTFQILTKHEEIHFIELPLLSETSASISPDLKKWLLFLKASTKEEFTILTERDDQLKKAYQRLEKLSSDPTNRELYEARDKELRDLASAIEYNVMNKTHQIAINMLKEGVPPVTIAKCTELSLSFIEGLKKTLQLSKE